MTMITSVAGNGAQGYDGDNGPATQALMDNPFHVDLDRTERYLYIADCFNYCVRMVDLQTGSITTIVGMGEAGYSGDRGPAVEARIEEPYAIQVADNGDVYVLQRFSPAIRKVDASTGMISTVAGDGTVGYSGDGGPATQAQMREPNDCALDGKGGLLCRGRPLRGSCLEGARLAESDPLLVEVVTQCVCVHCHQAGPSLNWDTACASKRRENSGAKLASSR